jgi:sulfate adenylyltransferase subunit 2
MPPRLHNDKWAAMGTGHALKDNHENRSVFIIREAYQRFRNIGLLWSMGKDSTTLVWLAKKAFFGKIPFPVVHIDTSFKFKEIYEFRDRLVKKWGLDLVIARNAKALDEGMSPENSKFNCCNALKTEALKLAIKEHGFKALLLAIRRDEHGIRAKERYFSPRSSTFEWDYRNQPLELWDHYKSEAKDDGHLRIHPMLHWTELDVWEYIKRERIPVVDLYFARDKKRYRSIGCECCCEPIDSGADNITKVVKELKTAKEAERSGRAQDKEDAYTMQRLRSLGYM